MFGLDRKGGKDQDEHKNIINRETPFHQISTDVLKRDDLAIFDPHKDKKAQGERYPEKSLVQGLADSDDLVLFTQKTQVKRQRKDQENSKNNKGDLIRIHEKVLEGQRYPERGE